MLIVMVRRPDIYLHHHQFFVLSIYRLSFYLISHVASYLSKPKLQIIHAWPRLCELASELPHRSAPEVVSAPPLHSARYLTSPDITSILYHASSPLLPSRSMIYSFYHP
ncbi:hypothetical protein HBI73_084190 [Parastagonospora nodorum]|nr:hypothetical protein HBI73_084190 [Parastagonospora nodorum]KAH6201962.1 hypothetical protein HBI53_145910 [Parastagonospora nodorum]